MQNDNVLLKTVVWKIRWENVRDRFC